MAKAHVFAVGAVVALLVVLATPAGAQYIGGSTPTVPGAVLPSSGSRTPGAAVPGGVLGSSGSRTTDPVTPVAGGVLGSSGRRVALTGTDVVQLAVIAGGLVLTGVVLTRSARRHRLTRP